MVGGALVLCKAQSSTVGPTKPLPGNPGSLFAEDPNLLIEPSDDLGTRELFYKMMLSVLLVVVLGAAAIYISKKLGARITNLAGKEIRIIETAHLGPRRAVHLLKIGNQRILIGSTTEHITKLADVTEALTDLSSQETGDNLRT